MRSGGFLQGRNTLLDNLGCCTKNIAWPTWMSLPSLMGSKACAILSDEELRFMRTKRRRDFVSCGRGWSGSVCNEESTRREKEHGHGCVDEHIAAVHERIFIVRALRGSAVLASIVLGGAHGRCRTWVVAWTMVLEARSQR